MGNTTESLEQRSSLAHPAYEEKFVTASIETLAVDNSLDFSAPEKSPSRAGSLPH
jgi:hypothetical protein